MVATFPRWGASTAINEASSAAYITSLILQCLPGVILLLATIGFWCGVCCCSASKDRPFTRTRFKLIVGGACLMLVTAGNLLGVIYTERFDAGITDRKSTRLNSSHR